VRLNSAAELVSGRGADVAQQHAEVAVHGAAIIASISLAIKITMNYSGHTSSSLIGIPQRQNFSSGGSYFVAEIPMRAGFTVEECDESHHCAPATDGQDEVMQRLFFSVPKFLHSTVAIHVHAVAVEGGTDAADVDVHNDADLSDKFVVDDVADFEEVTIMDTCSYKLFFLDIFTTLNCAASRRVAAPSAHAFVLSQTPSHLETSPPTFPTTPPRAPARSASLHGLSRETGAIRFYSTRW
jgi:hypothetical protein